MNDLELCRKKARELLVGPLDVTDATVASVVDTLQLHSTLSDMENGSEDFPAGVPLVFLETNPDALRRVANFALVEGTPLSTALELLAAQGDLVVGYYATGILVSPLYAAAPADAPAMATPLFQGFPTVPSASIPGQPPLAAAAAVTADSQAEIPEGCNMGKIVALYPGIGQPGNVAGLRFWELYNAFRDPTMNLEALAYLVMLYPPRMERLPWDQDSFSGPGAFQH